jgi:predicted  nucleic acid-binding Zn-ribbon protein
VLPAVVEFEEVGSIMTAFRLSLPFCLVLLGLTGSSAMAEEKSAEKITFVDHVVPIFRAKCGNCHSAGEAKGGLVLESYGATMQGGASGAVVEAGDVDASRLYDLVSHKEQPAMPPKEPKMSEELLTTIRKWIEGGALENKDSVVKAKKKASFALSTTAVSTDKPEGPPAMPENLATEPLLVSKRGNAVTALAASPWAPLVAVAGHQQVLLYDLTNFTLAGALPFPEGTIHVLRFSRNGSLLLAAGGRGGQSGRVVVYDVKTGNRAFEIGSETEVVLGADISPDHSQIALGGPRKMVRIYSTADGELQYEMKKHTDWITTVEFSPDGVLLATGDRSNGLVVWEANTGREFYTLNGHGSAVTSVNWRVDSNVLATSSEDTTVRLWEMTNGTQVKSWGAHGAGAASVTFLRDGRLVSTGRDRVTKIWDQNGAQQLALAALADLGLKTTFSEPLGLVLAGDWTGTVKVFAAANGAELGTLLTNPAPVAARLEAAKAAAAAAEAPAKATADQLAALQKQVTDKQEAAKAAVKAHADAEAAIPVLAADIKKLEGELPAKVELVKTSETGVATLTAQVAKAKGDVEAADKANDAAAKEAARRVLETAEKDLATAQKVLEAAQAAKGALEKQVADLQAKHKGTVDGLPGLKAAADKSVAEMNPTPEMLKAIEGATAAAKQAAEVLARHQSAVARLTADLTRGATAAGK